MSHRQGRAGLHRPALHLPDVAHRPYWARLVPPGELPRRAVLIRLVLALALAAALWIGVSNAQDPAITVSYSNVQVTVVSPAGYYPVQGPPPVTVVLRGLSSNVKDAPRPLAFAYPRALFPMTAQSVPIVVKNLPPGAEVVKVTPPTVTLRLEPQATKALKVDVQIVSGVPIGYEPSQPIVNPPSVTVTGPSHTVSTVAAARVFLNESDYRSDRTRTLRVVVFDNKGQPVSRRIVLVKPSEVSVTVHVHIQPHRGSVPVEADIKGSPATGYRIASITASPPLVEVLSNSSVPSTFVLKTVPISVDGLSNNARWQVPLVQPPGITLVHQVLETITVAVSPIPGSAVTKAGIQVVNKRPGTTLALSNTSITVAYQGPIPSLNLATAPLTVLDLGNRPPGVYYLRPRVTLPKGLSVISLTPAVLRVTITAPPAPHLVVPTATPTPTVTPRPTNTPRPTATSHPRPSATAFVPIGRVGR